MCQTLGVEIENGAIQTAYGDDKELASAVHRVAQAAARVADIWFTLRIRPVEGAADEVESWLGEHSFTFSKGVSRTGRSGRWTVDFEVTAGGSASQVFVLSSRSRAAAVLACEKAYSACSDLRGLPGEAGQAPIISLFDDTVDVWREEDIEKLQGVSRPAMWSRPDDFERALTAG